MFIIFHLENNNERAICHQKIKKKKDKSIAFSILID